MEANLVNVETLQNPLCLNLKLGGFGGGKPGWRKLVSERKRVASRMKKSGPAGYSKHRIGYKFSDASKKLLSEKAKSRERVICPACNKEGPIVQMKRWHLDNCREA